MNRPTLLEDAAPIRHDAGADRAPFSVAVGFVPPDAGPDRPLFSVADRSHADEPRPLFAVDAAAFPIRDAGGGEKS